MPDRTVIVASRRPELVSALSDAGFSVIGPVTTASMALMLASQAPAALAVVDRELAGRRMGPELAAQLFETWGVRSVLVGEAEEADEEEAAPAWAASPRHAEPLLAVLSRTTA